MIQKNPLETSLSPKAALVITFLSTLLAAPGTAQAFCRTTTCEPNISCVEDAELCCRRNALGCDEKNPPISWPTACVSYSIQEDGSEKLDISASTLSDIVDDAFDGWLNGTCAEGPLSLTVENKGLVTCNEPEFNEGPKDGNANIWMFRDSGSINGYSPKEGQVEIDANALAVTTVNFVGSTAEIYDVDVELNSAIANFTTGDQAVDMDLASVVTHEAGHFLGLDHSRVDGATMRARYQSGDISPRTLSADDLAGICASYPLDRDLLANASCDPRGEYSGDCYEPGCSCDLSAAQGSRPGPLTMWTASLLSLALLRRRKGSRNHQAEGAGA